MKSTFEIGDIVVRRGGGTKPMRVISIDGEVVIVESVSGAKKSRWIEILSELMPYDCENP